MSEDSIVYHCAPTLAGIKTGNLFSAEFHSKDELIHFARTVNRQLTHKGLRFLLMRADEKRALFYLYRPSALQRDLQSSTARKILTKRGYNPQNCDVCVAELARRLRTANEFPHEIGLFLGYPPEDVYGFIHNKASDYKCVGCWKVYGDENAARQTFAKYKKCTNVYCQQWKKERNIERLAVADWYR